MSGVVGDGSSYCRKRFATLNGRDIKRLMDAGVPRSAVDGNAVDLDAVEQLGWKVARGRLVPPAGRSVRLVSLPRLGLRFTGFLSVDTENGFSCSREDRVVTIAGDFDVTTIDEVGRCFDDTSDSGEIQVDLSGVTFVDMAALRVLALADQNPDRRLVLLSPSEAVQRLLDASQLGERFTIIA